MHITFSKYARRIAIVAASATLFLLGAQRQGSSATLPTVLTMGVPTYPEVARVAHLEGLVRLEITTDGKQVIAARVEDGPALLAAAAERNARTWQFSPHEPLKFTVVYRYNIVSAAQGDIGTAPVTLRLPTELEISALPYEEAVRSPERRH